MTPDIEAIIDELKNHRYAWDGGQSPLDKLVEAVHKKDITALKYLLYHVSARVLPCWESYCTSERPRNTINTIKTHLQGEAEADRLSEYITETPPCVHDCRYSDTMSASEAIAMAAAYMLDEQPLTGAACIEGADCAFGHIFTNDKFKGWLLDVAIPIAFEKRFMTEEELGSFAVNDFTLAIYHSLFYPLERPSVAEEKKSQEDKIDTPPVTRQQKSWWKFW